MCIQGWTSRVFESMSSVTGRGWQRMRLAVNARQWMTSVRQTACNVGQDREPRGTPVREGWTYPVAEQLAPEA